MYLVANIFNAEAPSTSRMKGILSEIIQVENSIVLQHFYEKIGIQGYLYYSCLSTSIPIIKFLQFRLLVCSYSVLHSFQRVPWPDTMSRSCMYKLGHKKYSSYVVVGNR